MNLAATTPVIAGARVDTHMRPAFAPLLTSPSLPYQPPPLYPMLTPHHACENHSNLATSTPTTGTGIAIVSAPTIHIASSTNHHRHTPISSIFTAATQADQLAPSSASNKSHHDAAGSSRRTARSSSGVGSAPAAQGINQQPTTTARDDILTAATGEVPLSAEAAEPALPVQPRERGERKRGGRCNGSNRGARRVLRLHGGGDPCSAEEQRL